jgi:hypothetical protein
LLAFSGGKPVTTFPENALYSGGTTGNSPMRASRTASSGSMTAGPAKQATGSACAPIIGASNATATMNSRLLAR